MENKWKLAAVSKSEYIYDHKNRCIQIRDIAIKALDMLESQSEYLLAESQSALTTKIASDTMLEQRQKIEALLTQFKTT